jgi:hypothetical protein
MKTLAGLVGTQPLEWWLKNLQIAKFLGSRKKTLACANFARTANWMIWYKKIVLSQNALLNMNNMNRVFNSKCSRC